MKHINYSPDTIDECLRDLSDALRRTAAAADATELILSEISLTAGTEKDSKWLDDAQTLAGIAAFHTARAQATLDKLSLLYNTDVRGNTSRKRTMATKAFRKEDVDHGAD